MDKSLMSSTSKQKSVKSIKSKKSKSVSKIILNKTIQSASNNVSRRQNNSHVRTAVTPISKDKKVVIPAQK